MWHLGVPAWQLVARSAIIYLALFIALRLVGKREVGQFTLFDLVLVLLVANAVQPAMTGPDSSVTGGLIIIVTLFVIAWFMGFMRLRSPLWHRLMEPRATIIARDGHWLQSALRHEGLEPHDCMMALREHGVVDVAEVRLMVLETDGTISVVPRSVDLTKSRHRVGEHRRL